MQLIRLALTRGPATDGRYMARGRKRIVTDRRLLLEVFLIKQPVFVGDVSENVQIGREAVRQRLEKLEEEGMVSIERANDVSIYRLTEAGGSELRAELREAVS